jgi:hypothetical protein
MFIFYLYELIRTFPHSIYLHIVLDIFVLNQMLVISNILFQHERNLFQFYRDFPRWSK